MILQLQPEHVSLIWPDIKKAIKEIEQINDEILYNKALKNILSGYYQCWISYKMDENNQQDIYAIAITSIYNHPVFDYSGLYINYVYAFKSIDIAMRNEAMKAFFNYAKQNNCKEITTDSENPVVERILSKFNFTKQTRYKFNLED